MRVTSGSRRVRRCFGCAYAKRSVVSFIAAGMLLLYACTAMAAQKRTLTIRDAFETTRLMVADSMGRSIAVAPDGKHYAAMLIHGDVRRDGVVVEIVAGSLASLDAAKPYTVATLFTRGLGGTELSERDATQLLMPTTNFPAWIDNHRIAFLWEDAKGVHQAAVADIRTRQWRILTASPTDVTGFAVGGHGVLVYEAKKARSFAESDRLKRQGYVITSPDAYALLIGVVDGLSAKDVWWGSGERYVQTVDPSPTTARKIRVSNGGENTYSLNWPLIPPAVSPDGRLAVVPGTPREISADWNAYKGDVLQAALREWKEDRRGHLARQIQQLFVVDTVHATARPLWNAPLSMTHISAIRWSPDSRSVVVWPAYLPTGGRGDAHLSDDAVVDIDAATGSYTILPVSSDDMSGLTNADWISPNEVSLTVRRQHRRFEKRSGEWTPVSHLDGLDDSSSPVTVMVRQDANSPPALYAVDRRDGRERLILDPNPRLRTEFTLGKVRFIQWSDKEGRAWEGRLFLPVGYKEGRRYPLVIQTHQWGRKQDFTLYGQGSPRPTLGPSTSVYLAQPLANQGIAVLQVGPSPTDSSSSELLRDEAKTKMEGFTSAIDYLVKAGMVDRGKVGIMGHSRSGWHVEYTLAFSDFPFAAAIVDDNTDAGYFEAGMMGWLDEERRNKTEPFGAGMKEWLENSPTFNVEHIRSPLLMMVTDSFAGEATPVAEGWEMFSRLRHLEKPVEFWIAPNLKRGSHGLQNPTQLLTQQQRAMDWWLYWLRGERDPSKAKQQQYAAWDELRLLKAAEDKRGSPPRLDWQAAPVVQSEDRADRSSVDSGR